MGDLVRTKTSVPDTYGACRAWLMSAQHAKTRIPEPEPVHTGKFCECGRPKPKESRHGGCDRCTELDSMGKIDASMEQEVLTALAELQSATVAEISDRIDRPPWQTMSMVTRMIHSGKVGKTKQEGQRFRYHLTHG